MQKKNPHKTSRNDSLSRSENINAQSCKNFLM